MDDRSGTWELGIQVKSRKPLRGKGVALKNFPATTVVAIKFDPKQLSPSVAYSSLEGWMRWTGRRKKYKWNGPWREVYPGNPWKSSSAWAHTEIQAPLKK